MEISWTEFKKIVDARNLSIQYVEIGNNYWLKAMDGYFSVECFIPLDPNHEDTSVFEASYKSTGNKSPTINTSTLALPPFGSKTMVINGVTKKLYARFTGMQQAVTAGSNTLSFTITYPWVKIIGVEVIGAENLDTADLKIKDTATGTYSGVANYVLNQFSYTLNLSKDFYQKMAQFDADIYQGMVIEVTYVSISDKTIGFNILMNEVKS